MIIDVDIYIILMILVSPIISYCMYQVEFKERVLVYFLVSFLFMMIVIILFFCHLTNCKL